MAKTITQRPSGTGKRLTLSEKILLRAEKGQLSVRKTAEKYGVSTATVERYFGNVKLANMEREVATVKEHLADRLYLTADNCVDQVQAALSDASSKDSAIALGILIDKARLIGGESTQNINTAHAFLDHINSIPVTEGLE